MVRFTQAERTKDDISLIILHLTDGESNMESVISWWEREGIQASYHYGIDRDGTVTKIVDPSDIAWHSGNWEVNTRSIGISFVGKYEGFKPTVEQLRAARKLMADLSYKYELSLKRIYNYGSGRIHMPFGVGQHANVRGATHIDVHPTFDIRRLCMEAMAYRNDTRGKIPVERR